MTNTRLFKKILVILLITVMFAAIFVACTQDEASDIQQTTTFAACTTQYGTDDIQQATADFDDEIAPISKYERAEVLPPFELVGPAFEVERIPTNLPERDFDGHIFRVLTATWEESWTMFSSRDIVAEELIGNPLNDAIYHRNAVLEERYNFVIEQVLVENPFATTRSAVMAGDSHFDVSAMSITHAARAAQEGTLVDLFTVDYLDFEKPWWDRGAIEGMSIGNRLFFTSGDFLLINKDMCPAILFNKQLLADLQLDCPYELVRSGRWTMGVLYEMARAAMINVDGTGIMNPDTDIFGNINSDVLNPLTMFNALGVRFAEKDENDLPFLTYGTERGFRARDVIWDFMFADFSRRWGALTGQEERRGPERAFAEGRGLFMGATIIIVEELRGMGADFGILPLPWLDEYQREWGHSLSTTRGQALAIPDFHNSDALDKVGFMLEAISAESRYTVIPTHHDIQLQGQLIRDEESSEMLDIIFNSMIWDTGIIFDWFGFTRSSGQLSFTASHFESERGVVEAAMQATVDALASMD